MANVYFRSGNLWLPVGSPPPVVDPGGPVDPNEPLDIPFSGGPLSAYLRDPSGFVDPLTLSPGCRIPVDQLEVLTPTQARDRAFSTGRLDGVLINGRLTMTEPFWGNVKGEDIVVYAPWATGFADGTENGVGYGIDAWWSGGTLPPAGKRPFFNYITILGRSEQPGYTFNPNGNQFTQRGVIGGPIHLKNVLIRGCGGSAFLHTRDVLVERFKFMDYTRGSGDSHVGGMQITHANGTAVFRDGVISGYFGQNPGFNASPGDYIGSACVQLGSSLVTQIDRLLYENVVVSGGSYGFQGPSKWRTGVTPPPDGFVSDSGFFHVRYCKSLRDHRQNGVAWAGTGEATLSNNTYIDNGQSWT